jgi:phosphatidylglycerophosphate synthase
MIRLDRIILESVLKNTDYLKNVNPNHVTFISLILNIIIYFNLKDEKDNNILKILLIIRWFTDCLDGFIARKYKKVSKFGKFFDKLTDSIFIMIMIHYFTKNKYLALLYLIIDNLIYNENEDKNKLIDFITNNSIIIYSLIIHYL